MHPQAFRRHERPAKFHHDPTNPAAHGPHAEFGVHAAGRYFTPGLMGPGLVPPFGPRGRGRGRAGRGDIRAVILSLLTDGPSNGYGIIKTIAERSGGVWRPSPGSVYPTLQQLVDEELIESSGEGRRTEFTLTEAGATYVKEHAEELARAWESGAPKRSEQELAFQQSVGKLMGVVGQFHHAASDAQRQAAIEKLDEARRALYLILAD
ncbi:PadR family transcriptional regulator [Protaetiibacter intestinalis]|uniref:PadR family transcriptional regulator n=1 Tax=Protaetiibacter intestinalis TaxID=2419774 RepID=A0A387B9U8_9MICO|nr:PadR family transcriptional regulator [Protaetiibacter intestinalis]AYF97886.1 PadR family transcriptional regulator [Protaetiibacter intestinalis]